VCAGPSEAAAAPRALLRQPVTGGVGANKMAAAMGGAANRKY